MEWAELSGPGYRVVAAGVETATVRAGGGTDEAVFYDSPGDDELKAWPSWATMTG